MTGPQRTGDGSLVADCSRLDTRGPDYQKLLARPFRYGVHT